MGVSILGSPFRPTEEAVTSKARVDFFSYWWVSLVSNFDAGLPQKEGRPNLCFFS